MYRPGDLRAAKSGRFMYRPGDLRVARVGVSCIAPAISALRRVGDSCITHFLPKPPPIPRSLSSSSRCSVTSASDATTSLRLRISVISVLSLCRRPLQPPFVFSDQSTMNY